MFWYSIVVPTKRKSRKKSATKKISASQKHYLAYKEAARTLVRRRLDELNVHGFVYNRVAIKNMTSRWGSCSSKKNLNFSYRIVFLPSYLQDYIIVHELCHLKVFNHSSAFWDLVAEMVPDYKACRGELRKIVAKKKVILSDKP
jgi:predicted metal-dependent hydrolase